MHFTFTDEHTDVHADEIVDYLRGPRLWIPDRDYPDYGAWTAKVHGQLKAQAKRAMLCYAGRWLAGAVIYQCHPTERRTVEIKNITVRPDQQGRLIASFLLRQVEVESRLDFQAAAVTIDAKARNFGIRRFLLQHRYLVIGQLDLYGLNAGDDLVYRKRLSPLVHG